MPIPHRPAHSEYNAAPVIPFPTHTPQAPVCIMHVNTRRLRSASRFVCAQLRTPGIAVPAPIALRTPVCPVRRRDSAGSTRAARFAFGAKAPLPLQAWRAGRSMPPAQRTSCLGLLLHDYMYMSLRRLLSCDGRHNCYHFMLTLHSTLLHLGMQILIDACTNS